MTNSTLPQTNICVPPSGVSQREWLDFVLSDIKRAYKIDGMTEVLFRRVATAMMAFHGAFVITDNAIDDRSVSNYISFETMRDFVLRLTVDKGSMPMPIYPGTKTEAIDRSFFLRFLTILTDILESEKGKAIGFSCKETNVGEAFKAHVFAEKVSIF